MELIQCFKLPKTVVNVLYFRVSDLCWICLVDPQEGVHGWGHRLHRQGEEYIAVLCTVLQCVLYSVQYSTVLYRYFTVPIPWQNFLKSGSQHQLFVSLFTALVISTYSVRYFLCWTQSIVLFITVVWKHSNPVQSSLTAQYYHHQQKVWCVLQLERGTTFPQLCQNFRNKYVNAGVGFRRVPPSKKQTVNRSIILLPFPPHFSLLPFSLPPFSLLICIKIFIYCRWREHLEDRGSLIDWRKGHSGTKVVM